MTACGFVGVGGEGEVVLSVSIQLMPVKMFNSQVSASLFDTSKCYIF